MTHDKLDFVRISFSYKCRNRVGSTHCTWSTFLLDHIVATDYVVWFSGIKKRLGVPGEVTIKGKRDIFWQGIQIRRCRVTFRRVQHTRENKIISLGSGSYACSTPVQPLSKIDSTSWINSWVENYPTSSVWSFSKISNVYDNLLSKSLPNLEIKKAEFF